jgi:RNA-directed DNA polymerase
MIRYADDLVIGFARREDAEKVLEWMGRRMAECGLRLHPEKTRLVPFARPRGRVSGKGPGPFDVLGLPF